MSVRIKADFILMDIEGTTSSIEFVHRTLFPFARQRAEEYIRTHWKAAGLQETLELLARDCDQAGRESWFQGLDDSGAQALVLSAVLAMMDRDAKATGLKELQGQIWQSGFESGQLKSHVFPDVPPAFQRWNSAGIRLGIYSSGSVRAQKLFFEHTELGNLLDLLGPHFDTTVGTKREQASYQRIAESIGLAPARIAFLSDIPQELDAARMAEYQTVLCCRPGNAGVPVAFHPRISSFDELQASLYD